MDYKVENVAVEKLCRSDPKSAYAGYRSAFARNGHSLKKGEQKDA